MGKGGAVPWEAAPVLREIIADHLGGHGWWPTNEEALNYFRIWQAAGGKEGKVDWATIAAWAIDFDSGGREAARYSIFPQPDQTPLSQYSPGLWKINQARRSEEWNAQ